MGVFFFGGDAVYYLSGHVTYWRMSSPLFRPRAWRHGEQSVGLGRLEGDRRPRRGHRASAAWPPVSVLREQEISCCGWKAALLLLLLSALLHYIHCIESAP